MMERALATLLADGITSTNNPLIDFCEIIRINRCQTKDKFSNTNAITHLSFFETQAELENLANFA